MIMAMEVSGTQLQKAVWGVDDIHLKSTLILSPSSLEHQETSQTCLYAPLPPVSTIGVCRDHQGVGEERGKRGFHV
jgi:hypothetical protein